jgi:hypothetical protein
MNYTELEKKAMQDELSSLNYVLSPYLYGKEYDEELVRLSPADVDRDEAEALAIKEVENLDMTTKPSATAGADYAVLQEDQRIRRDAVISRQGHKRLMQGCLETAFRRMRKLEKDLEDRNAV